MSTELKRAFQQLCGEYEELVDEAAELTHPMDERIGLALFKIDEACAMIDTVRMDAVQSQEQVLESLLANCNELEDIFLRINLIERFVNRMHETTCTLEKRMDTVSRAAAPVFNTSGVTNLFRTLTTKRGTSDSDMKWEPVEFDFNTKELMDRLEKENARDLGVSIAAVSSTAVEKK